MERFEIDQLMIDSFDCKAEFLFRNDKTTAVYRHPIGKKWFAIIMEIPCKKLGLFREGNVTVMNLKSDPDLIETLVLQQGFHRAYHMNKRHWITLDLSLLSDPDQIIHLLSMSHRLTKTKIDP